MHFLGQNQDNKPYSCWIKGHAIRKLNRDYFVGIIKNLKYSTELEMYEQFSCDMKYSKLDEHAFSFETQLKKKNSHALVNHKE